MNLLAEFREGLFIGWDAILANKLRSGLATLGIVIGVVTVTSMATAISGMHRAFLESISTLGGDVLFVERNNWMIQSNEEWQANRKRPQFTLTQARELERRLTQVRAVASVASVTASISFQSRDAQNVSVVGTTDQFLQTSGFSLAEGRFLTAAEVEGGRPVCVLGAEIAGNLFPAGNVLGERIRLGSANYQVIGVLERIGGLAGMTGADSQAVIPMRRLVSTFVHNPHVTVQVKALSLETLGETRDEVRGILRTIRQVEPGEPDNFAINEQEQFVSMFQRVTGTIAAVGLFVTGLSLFVGSVGIMNIMFVSVTERTREIGVRKAIGARPRTILFQFLIEAMSICLLGGLLALAIAWPITLGMGQFFPARLSLPIVAMALSVTVVIGLVSGLLPALRAARMNPVDALRNE